ncbi:hypothetical protein BC939DRAFT_134507 [Gamsiella multidivaricata]|uniref:uncharacterized protein n=1 Tax=Gamsiella multidivaricata TaxID=101098 RepID=UPI002220156F|nr:uncharacterized protein BC939DRAFT_134507 [Gamsiella multidivaricata]KAI7824766.1 hypothetical protein BC939DRAFT_134507 [Gamsiella multidivaricata]
MFLLSLLFSSLHFRHRYARLHAASDIAGHRSQSTCWKQKGNGATFYSGVRAWRKASTAKEKRKSLFSSLVQGWVVVYPRNSLISVRNNCCASTIQQRGKITSELSLHTRAGQRYLERKKNGSRTRYKGHLHEEVPR